MQQIYKNKKQKGFSILAVILVIVAVIVTIGVWALSGQTNTTSTGASALNIQAASIINDANVIKSEFNRLIINGNNPNTIGFYPQGTQIPENVTVNILDPIHGIQLPKANSLSFYNPDNMNYIGNWSYGYFKIRDVGLTNNLDQVIVISGIKSEVCESINNSIHGSKTLPAYEFLPISESGYTNTFDGIADLDQYAPITAGWTSGCLNTPDSQDVSGNTFHYNEGTYFLVLKAN